MCLTFLFPLKSGDKFFQAPVNVQSVQVRAHTCRLNESDNLFPINGYALSVLDSVTEFFVLRFLAEMQN